MSKYLDVSECTPGEWVARQMGGSYAPQYGQWEVDSDAGESVAHLWYLVEDTHDARPLSDSEEQQEANAYLIAEAGTVAHETGKGPRQLADERAALLEAVKAVAEHIDPEYTRATTTKPGALKLVQAAITLAEGGGE